MFNAIAYSSVIAYILYINFAAYYNTGTKFLNGLVRVFNNWVFRLFYLLFVGYFSLDLFKYGGFTYAILLTIAFLNTNMLMYKKEVSESFQEHMSNMMQEEEGNKFKDEYVRNTVNENNETFAAPTQRLPFNPGPYRPDDSVMSSGVPDPLPEDPLKNGPYTTSGVGYEFNMA